MRKLFNNQSGRVSKGILSLILAVSMLLAVLTPVRALADDAAPSEVQIQEEAVGSPAPEEAETAASAEESPIQVEMQVQEAPAAEAAQAEALPSDAAAEPAAVEAASVEPAADEAEKSSAAPAASDQAETEIGNTIPNIETENRQLLFHTVGGEVRTYMTLSATKELLPAGEFVQVNRFQIVPLEGILEAGAAELKLKDGTVLAIGAKHADDFRKVYDSYRSGKKS